MAHIVVDNIQFAYKTLPVLHNLNMSIEAGDFVCILGESGCGKSTFLRLLAGLLQPASGKITIDGRPITGAGLDRGVVFQDYSLFPWFTNGKNILLSLRQKYRDATTEELTSIVLKGLDDVGLDQSVFNKFPFELSGGMRQRCAICRAFALDPPVLLMDEPFGALDAITRTRLQQTILKLWQRDSPTPKTIVFVTHDVNEALLLANKIYVFGASPKGIIHYHAFNKNTKPAFENMFNDSSILTLRNTLVQTLADDITSKL